MAHRDYTKSLDNTLNFIKVPHQTQVRDHIIHLLIDRRDFDGIGGSMDPADLKLLIDVLPDHEDFMGWKLIKMTDDAYLLENSQCEHPADALGSMMAAVVDATHMTVGAA